MTTTVKLPDPLENALPQRCAQESRSISEVMRDALTAYLAQPVVTASAFALDEGAFGRFSGPLMALLNRSDTWHAATLAWRQTHPQVRLHSNWPVLAGVGALLARCIHNEAADRLGIYRDAKGQALHNLLR